MGNFCFFMLQTWKSLPDSNEISKYDNHADQLNETLKTSWDLSYNSKFVTVEVEDNTGIMKILFIPFFFSSETGHFWTKNFDKKSE